MGSAHGAHRPSGEITLRGSEGDRIVNADLELDRAWDALDVAYEAARRSGYQLDGHELQALRRAEHDYVRLRHARRSTLDALDPDPLNNVIDLRDP